MSIRSVAVVGTGAVGEALARNLVSRGIRVQLASRDEGKTGELAKALGEHARAVATKAIEGVDAVFLAVPAAAAPAVLEEATGIGSAVVLDCTNPIAWDKGPVHAPPEEGSMAAHLAKRFPKARVVKAFNTFGAEFHANPKLGGTVADLYFAGDDADAKRVVGEIAKTMGFEPVDVGPLRNARNLEALAVLWIHLATVGGKGRDVAFKLTAR